ncbi:MAG: hypothetical protein Q8S02_12365 [Hydrogenophaga sp.]|nr:hypothetical protein [Hydrogenophaga sp.]
MTGTFIPSLRVEQQDGLVLVSQRRDGQTATVALHQAHIRHLAEQCGLAPAKQIATLALRLRVLHRRIDELGYDLTNSPDLDHALEQALALAEIADAYIADLPDAPGQAP